MAFVSAWVGVGLLPAGARPAGARCAAGYRTIPPPVAMAGRGFGAAGFGKPKFKYTGNLRPAVLSPTRSVPPTIPRPSYADTGTPKEMWPALPWDIEVKTPEQIQSMRNAGRVARQVLDAAARAVAVGVTTDHIDAVVHDETIKRGAYPSPLNYNHFPKSCCTSLNEVICHGIPDSTQLKSGDIINIDVTCFLNGVHGDCSETFAVGDVDQKGLKLIRATYDAFQQASEICKPGVAYQDIGGVIEDIASVAGFKSVAAFCGHGIGHAFHTAPNVLHYRNREPNGTMKPGHTFTIEPMFCEGTQKSVVWPDKWTATTTDGRRSAQFEHTFLITETGVEALTARLPDSPAWTWK